ncbi:MAG: isoprenylcysteine carboxylmethyltransferase family protein [Bacteroidetes bacterium]|nr:isoprenylcysteine carboxylmethyltransferase family protein [Bacteroidota bacterium]
MALIHSLEKEGNWLFRHRGPLPAVLFLLAVPAVYLADYSSMSEGYLHGLNVLSVFICSVGFLIRAYTIGTTPKGTSGRNTEQQVAEQLNSTGIYSIVRHPLYLGNYLMWIGIVLYTKNFSFVIIVSLLFWIYYERIMFAEERFLERKFGEAYLQWSMKAPAFIPRLSRFVKSNIPFSIKSVLRREYSGILATVFGFAFVNLLMHALHEHQWRLDDCERYTLIVTTLVVVVLRTIKHQTHWLEEEGRS